MRNGEPPPRQPPQARCCDTRPREVSTIALSIPVVAGVAGDRIVVCLRAAVARGAGGACGVAEQAVVPLAAGVHIGGCGRTVDGATRYLVSVLSCPVGNAV